MTRFRCLLAALAPALVLLPTGPALRAAPPADMAALVQGLRDADPKAREQAAAQLGQMGPAAVAPLMAALTHEDPYLRGAAAVALGQIGEAAVPALARSLGSDNAELRWSATIALGRLGAPASQALPELTRLLADPSAQVRQVAAATLGGLAGIGGVAETAAPALTRCLSDRDPDVRRSAALALARVAPADRARQLRHETLVATLDQLVPTLLAEHHVPGLAIALIRDRQLVWSKGYGVRAAGAGEAVTPGTVFEAASMSKPIFALLAMQLVDAHRLDLDRPLVQYGPEALVPDQPEKRLVTARMALSHTTGYPNWRPGGEEREGPLPLLFQPGSRFGYSGEGIFYLQRRVEWITGQPLDLWAQRSLFDPLGLADSSFAWTQRIGARQATGHADDGAPQPRSTYLHPNAAYSLYTTAPDYARLLVEVMKAERGESALLSRAAAQEMLKHQVAVAGAREPIERPGAAQGQAVYWGLGWSLNATAQGDIAHHSGANATGFRSFSQFSPTRGSGLVVLTNGTQGDDLWARLVAAIGDL